LRDGSLRPFVVVSGLLLRQEVGDDTHLHEHDHCDERYHDNGNHDHDPDRESSAIGG